MERCGEPDLFYINRRKARLGGGSVTFVLSLPFPFLLSFFLKMNFCNCYPFISPPIPIINETKEERREGRKTNQKELVKKIEDHTFTHSSLSSILPSHIIYYYTELIRVKSHEFHV